MNSSTLIALKLKIGPNKLFQQGSKTKKWQIEAKPTWPLVLEGKSIDSDPKKNSA